MVNLCLSSALSCCLDVLLGLLFDALPKLLNLPLPVIKRRLWRLSLECASDLLLCYLDELDNNFVTFSYLSWLKSLDLKFEVATTYLGERFLATFNDGSHSAWDIRSLRQRVSAYHVNAKDDQGLSKGHIESLLASDFLDLVDTHED